MPNLVLTGGRARRSASRRTSSRRRPAALRLPKLPRGARGRRRRAAASVSVPSVATASASEREALRNLAQRLQRGNYAGWRTADTPTAAASEAARTAAATGQPAVAMDLQTGSVSQAVPLSGSGRRRRTTTSSGGRKRKSLRGGFLPALIPIIAAAIGAIPGIAGTAVAVANLKEQQRQFNKMYENANRRP
nr:major core protein [Tawny frogmouth aviadenovirus A]